MNMELHVSVIRRSTAADAAAQLIAFQDPHAMLGGRCSIEGGGGKILKMFETERTIPYRRFRADEITEVFECNILCYESVTSASQEQS